MCSLCEPISLSCNNRGSSGNTEEDQRRDVVSMTMELKNEESNQNSQNKNVTCINLRFFLHKKLRPKKEVSHNNINILNRNNDVQRHLVSKNNVHKVTYSYVV